MHTYGSIVTKVENGVMTVTLNHPDKLIAFSMQTAKDLIAAFGVAVANDAVRAVIVAGVERAFCAGFELDEKDAFTSTKTGSSVDRPRSLGKQRKPRHG